MGASSEHSILAPSGAYQWRKCAGAPNAQKDCPDVTGEEAAAGTLFHGYAEPCASFGLDPYAFVRGKKEVVDGHTVEFDMEMADSMVEGLAWIDGLMDDEDCVIFFEERVPTERWTGEKGGAGTCDIIVLFPLRRHIIMADWKYGLVAVSAERNDQLTLYGLGVWEKFGKRYFAGKPRGVTMEFRILQPRVPLRGSRWDTTMLSLLKEGQSIKVDAELAMSEDAPRAAGYSQCQYCRAREDCAEFQEHMMDMVALSFGEVDERAKWEEPPDLPSVDKMTPTRRSYILLHRKVFASWLEDIHTATIRELSAGKEVPDLKLVYGRRGSRMFRVTQLKQVKRQVFKDIGVLDAFTRKMLSPAAVEKKVGIVEYRKRYAKFVTQTDPKPVLVPLTDERPAIEPCISGFENIEGV